MKSTFAYLAVMLLAFGCTTARQAPKPQSEFKNLQVLPQDIPRDQLIATMRAFTRSLGVKCNGCHVVTATTPEEQLDFPSDAKEQKRVARVMLQMTGQINGPWMERVEKAEHPDEAVTPPTEMKVTCWTCHRGKIEPEPVAPAAAQ